MRMFWDSGRRRRMVRRRARARKRWKGKAARTRRRLRTMARRETQRSLRKDLKSARFDNSV